MSIDRKALTPARIAALRRVQADAVEYDATTATYWINDEKAERWKFRTMSDLGKLKLVRRSTKPGRRLVKLTPAGVAALDTLPDNGSGEPSS